MITQEKKKNNAIKRLVHELKEAIIFATSGCGSATAEQIDLMASSIKNAREMMCKNDNTVDVFEACEMLGVSKPTLYNWIHRGWLPKPIKKHETSIFFNKADIEKAKEHLKDT